MKLLELDAFDGIVSLKDAKDIKVMYNNDKTIFVEYTGVDGKDHHAQFDIIPTFKGDGGRTAFFEIIGYAEINVWGKPYGLNNEFAARVALLKGFANIYIPWARQSFNKGKYLKDLTDFYLGDSRITTIGKKMPFILREQMDFLIDKWKVLKSDNPSTADDIGLEQAVARLQETATSAEELNYAIAIQQAFGLITHDSNGNLIPIDVDANGHILPSCITSNFQKWWTNFWNSNQKIDDPTDSNYNGMMWDQVHR